jgi:hypothetical protein
VTCEPCLCPCQGLVDPFWVGWQWLGMVCSFLTPHPTAPGVCPTTAGFSGTPSDLLPRELRPCMVEPGSDAAMVRLLSSAHYVSHTLVQDWTVDSLLSWVATHDPPFHALIDRGALVRWGRWWVGRVFGGVGVSYCRPHANPPPILHQLPVGACRCVVDPLPPPPP